MNLWSSAEAWQAGGENLHRNKRAYYFLPSENEWYKAAFHKNDGATGNYWQYATKSNVVPDGIDFSGDLAFDAVFAQPFRQAEPNAVTNVGLTSPYGTFGQNGNVYEWIESAYDGANDVSDEARLFRGGGYSGTEDDLVSSYRYRFYPSSDSSDVGFRVASAELGVGSGPYAAWVAGFGLSGSDAGAQFDFDRDGLKNLLEYALGGSPLASDAAAIQPTVQTVASNMRLIAVIRTNEAALSVFAETTTDLTNAASWTSAGISPVADVAQTGVTAGFTRVAYDTPGSGNRRFLRLRVVLD